MRPRGRGDDVDDDDDEFEDVSPPRSTPDAEADQAPAPAPSPPPPQPARPALSSLVVKPPPQENGGGSSPPDARAARSPSSPTDGHRRGPSPPRRRREFSPPPGPRGWERRRSPPHPPERRRPPASPPPQRRRFSPPRFQPPRHPRFHDEPMHGYGMHSGPSPPRLHLRPRRLEPSTYDDADSPRYNRGYHGGGDRGGGRFREGSPPYGRGGRSYGRGYSAPGKEFINIDGEYVHRNDPNLSPREGDWICQNPNCGNLNFARRSHCNNCNKYRYTPEPYEPVRSPRRGYLSPPPRGPPRIVGPPGVRGPPREMARYKSPPHGYGGGPRGYTARSPPDRAGRFTEPSLKEGMGFRGDRDLRDRAKFEWSAPDDYSQRDRPHDGLFVDRNRRRSGSPRGNWGNDLRERSRSPPRNRPMKSSFTGRGHPDDYDGPYVSRARGRPNNLEAGRGRGRGYRPAAGPYPGEGRGDRRAPPHARNEDGY